MADIQLTAQQRGAVEDRGGSLLVSAAAGSGKTKVLVERVFAYLTEEHCHIDDFLIITFTRAAAAELRTKLAAELAKKHKLVVVGDADTVGKALDGIDAAYRAALAI